MECHALLHLLWKIPVQRAYLFIYGLRTSWPGGAGHRTL